MAGKLGENNKVLEEEKVFSKPIERVVYKDDVYSPVDAIERARKRLGETDYKLFSNNCESFVNLALINEDVTEQGRTGTLAVGTTAAAIVAGYIAMPRNY